MKRTSLKTDDQKSIHLNRVAIICSDKLSDGLMMMVASHRLMNEGSEVITFHSRLQELQSWFGDHHFQFRPQIEEIEKIWMSKVEELESY